MLIPGSYELLIRLSLTAVVTVAACTYIVAARADTTTSPRHRWLNIVAAAMVGAVLAAAAGTVG